MYMNGPPTGGSQQAAHRQQQRTYLIGIDVGAQQLCECVRELRAAHVLLDAGRHLVEVIHLVSE